MENNILLCQLHTQSLKYEDVKFRVSQWAAFLLYVHRLNDVTDGNGRKGVDSGSHRTNDVIEVADRLDIIYCTPISTVALE